MSAIIEVKGLRKEFTIHRKEPGMMGSVRSLFWRKFETKYAVKGVSFDINAGEIVGLVGANGAGKTTLVKMLAGIIHPSGGEARVLGYEPARRDDRMRRQMALIMGQKAQLWWDLPAADCFLLLKEIYRIPDQQFRQRLDRLATVLEVTKELNVQVRRLSLGERMKMELIAALLHTPKVVFLDEPTIGLDLSAQRAIREFILDYQREEQPAMIVTSHYMEDIERLCKRIMIIREGEMVYDGGLEEIIRHHARHKVLTIHLAEGAEARPAQELAPLGEVLESTREVVRLRVRREETAATLAQLATRLPVADIQIEEVDIGTIIERIMKERRE